MIGAILRLIIISFFLTVIFTAVRAFLGMFSVFRVSGRKRAQRTGQDGQKKNKVIVLDKDKYHVE